MKTAFLRALYLYGPFLIMFLGVFLFTPSYTPNPFRNDTEGIVLIIQAIALLYWFANIIVALLDRAEQRAIHDRLAKTRVIVVG